METIPCLTEKFNPYPDIAVLDIRPVEGRGSLRAFVSIQLGKLVISDCRIIKEPGKAAWFSLPVLSYKNEYGTALYKTLIQVVDRNLKNHISRVVLDAWEKTREEERNGTTME